jgi:N-acetyl-1-D-myo-inositol-2-amino-2-deoxy-alpha-D-glucopyranoside deacetylase
MMDEQTRVLLAVLAHPDDESFGMGGTLALYARQGVKVYLICATRGEAGMVTPEQLVGFDSIAEKRESELRCAAAELELTDVFFLDYRDSGMPGSADNQHPQALVAQPVLDVAVKVAHFIRLLKPQVVATFDPIGGYKHPDHIAIHQATVQAFKLASQPDFEDGLPPFQPQKLYYHLIPKGFLKFGVWLLRLIGKDPQHFGRNKDIDLTSLVMDGDFPINTRISYRQVGEQKDTASACHASQLDGGLSRGPMRLVRGLFGTQDYFMRAFPPAGKGKLERDLFAGL